MLFAPIPSQGAMTAPYTKYAALFSWGLRAADIVGLMLAGWLAYYLRFGEQAMSIDSQRFLASGLLIALFVFATSSLYRSWRGRSLAGELWAMFVAYSGIFVVSVLTTVALKFTGDVSRLWLCIWFLAALAIGGSARVLIRGMASWTRTRGVDVRSAVMVGHHDQGARVIASLERQRGAGIRMLGWFETDTCVAPEAGKPLLGSLDQLAAFVERENIDQVWIVLPMSAQAEISRVLELLAHSTADIKLVPDLLGLQLMNHSVEQIAGVPVINLRASPLDGDARLVKAIEDRVLAVLILILIAPLMALLAIGVKLSSPGPVLFRQPRHGLDGKIIDVWKFRSMVVHQEANGSVTQAARRDARVTPFGRLLRRTSMDELPQFINVLQGTMSIVGPRPHAVAHNHHYKNLVDEYMQRHRVKPGITGWAQVNGLRGETDTVDKMAARVEHDLHYLQNWSLALDLKIIVSTVFKAFLGKMAY